MRDLKERKKKKEKWRCEAGYLIMRGSFPNSIEGEVILTNSIEQSPPKASFIVILVLCYHVYFLVEVSNASGLTLMILHYIDLF